MGCDEKVEISVDWTLDPSLNNHKEELVERLADAEHASWSRWMLYLFSISQHNDDGSVTIPNALVQHWTRQAKDSYFDLKDSERDSDRKEVYRILPGIRVFVDAVVEKMIVRFTER